MRSEEWCASTVKTIKRDGKVIYVCEACGVGYMDEETARKCQEYCSKHGACSLELMRKAVYFPE